MKKLIVLIAIVLIATSIAVAQEATTAVLSMRERAEAIDRILENRLDSLVPALMRREGIDMWLVMAREYNEDPVIRTMLPAKWHAARRLSILLFHDNGETVERLAVARYDIGSFARAWNPEEEPNQWARLAELISERDPEKIGINVSEHFGLADGISQGLHEQFIDALPVKYRERVVSAERLAIGWLETRTTEEMALYPHIVGLARGIIAEGLSGQVIHPGITRTDDVEWWYRERIKEMKLDEWFHPTVSVQRAEGGENSFLQNFITSSNVILPGDLIHVDFGITYLRLNTDTQQHAYVLRMGELQAPEGLRRGLATANRLQDILTSQFVAGRTGNEILAASLAQAEAKGIMATIYTHPIGYHGHAAGPTIGLWDQQDAVPGKGDYPLYPNTAHSIELNAQVVIPEWDDKLVRFMLEEDAFFDGESVLYIAGRQTELYLVPRQ